jgi:hypothetical protein
MLPSICALLLFPISRIDFEENPLLLTLGDLKAKCKNFCFAIQMMTDSMRRGINLASKNSGAGGGNFCFVTQTITDSSSIFDRSAL